MKLLKKKIYIRAKDGVKLALHSWESEVKPSGLIFYIHGMQSHAAWCAPTADFFVNNNYFFYALDRRGSGESYGLRGDVASMEQLVDDYYRAFLLIIKLREVDNFYFVGQSLGGSILSAFLSYLGNVVEYKAVIFLSPALNHFHCKYNKNDLREIENNTSLSTHNTDLKDSDYTNQRKYLDYMKNDPMILRKITKRSRRTFLKLEKEYLTSGPFLKNKRTSFFKSLIDPVLDQESALLAYKKIGGDINNVYEFSTKKHYLEFSENKSEVLEKIKEFILGDI